MSADARVFDSAKRTILFKLRELIDYSPKGSIDAPIARFVPRLNAVPELVTTSSCSGRIAVYAHDGGHGAPPTAVVDNDDDGDAAGEPSAGAPGGSTKGAGAWLLVTHEDPLTEAGLSDALAGSAYPDAVLKVEPFILHVQARDLPAARRLLHVAIAAGFRESGITVGARGKTIVAVRTTASSLEVPLRAGGRTIVDAAYARELVAIANERFAEIGARRARFIAAFVAEYPAAAATVQAAAASDERSGSHVCSTCGVAFPSRNKLFGHLLPPPAAGGKPVCPSAPAPQAVVTAAAGAPPLLACSGCGAAFPSRNKLFRHVEACAPALQQKRLREGAAATATAATATPPPALRVSPSGAPLLPPSVPLTPVDVRAAESAEAAMRRALAVVAAVAAAGTASSAADDAAAPPPLQLQWEQLQGADAPPSLARWGHTATLLRPAAAASANPAAAPVVVAVGGVACVGVHGRSNDVLVYDCADGRWHVPEVAAGDAPPPMVRHAAVAVPLPGAGGGLEALLVTGGHNGPLRPTADSWWLTVERLAAGGGANDGAPHFRAAWHRAVVTSAAAPPLRWGHAAVTIPAGSIAGDLPAVAVFGGRDAHSSFGDVWVAELRRQATGNTPSLAWQQLTPSGAHWRPRFYHAAATLPSAAGGGVAGETLVAVHGGYPSPYLVAADDASSGGEGGVLPSPHLHAAAGGGSATALLADVALLRLTAAGGGVYTASWQPVAVQPTLPGGRQLEPRCSHSLLALPAQASRQQHQLRLLLLGGECEDPQHNAAQLLTLAATAGGSTATATVDTAADEGHDGHGYAALRSAALAARSPGAAAVSPSPKAAASPSPPPASGPDDAYYRRLPMLLRSAMVLLSGGGGAGCHSLLSVGGGGVCFAFGSHASPSYRCAVTVQ